jgi:uncharacterized protein DUF1566
VKSQAKAVLILLSLVAMISRAQSPTGPSTPAVAPQVRPALPQEQLPVPQEQDAAARERAEADKAQREAQAKEERRQAQETQARGYWIDPSTGLMWAAKDNGKDVTWGHAMKYCRNLRLAGYPDWRLATLDELARLVDKSVPAPDRFGNTETFYINIGPHVRGGLSLAGDPWSSNREKDRFGHPYGPGWFFNFITSEPSYDLQLFRNTKYALCMRRPGE